MDISLQGCLFCVFKSIIVVVLHMDAIKGPQNYTQPSFGVVIYLKLVCLYFVFYLLFNLY